jgi:predicted Fe-S protein YdhL (DUF1289 family)
VRLTGAPVADVVLCMNNSGISPGVASPCINVCRMDEATGWCEGCHRTLDEIAFWSVLDDERQRGRVGAAAAAPRADAHRGGRAWARTPTPSKPPRGDLTDAALVFHFDFISPFAYLAFERLPQVLQGCSYAVEYRPVLFAGLLQHWGQKGPAEIEPKRAWTFRQVHWLAQQHGVALDTPAEHPFNPLPLLRLALACSADHRPNRRVVEAIFGTPGWVAPTPWRPNAWPR